MAGSAWMSRSDPPTVDIFRAALVMKVRRPLLLEQPEKPRSAYHREKRFTIAWGEVRVVRSVVITKADGRPREGIDSGQKGRPQFPVQGDDPTASPALTRHVGQVDSGPDLAVRGRRHAPGQGRRSPSP